MSEKSSSRITTNHEEIKEWAKERGARPSLVKGVGEGVNSGLLRMDIIRGDGQEEGLEEISWEEFFKIFEKKRLAFLYDTDPESKFCKFVSRN